MARTERGWHPKFLKYMEMIAKHPHYAGLRITRRADGSYTWVTTGNSVVGKARKLWAENKAREMGLTVRAGVYADVMREIHPTKVHVCQICGSTMSIYYHYPSVNFIKALKNEFSIEFSECDYIGDIWDTLVSDGFDATRISGFMKIKLNLPNGIVDEKQAIITACEYQCRKNGKKALSPGVMSDFPDRYDGFHTYNRCCRAMQDTGRSKENLKSYTKDRRAYEYWSDGNIHAANMFMGSGYFSGTSADHIGPISLGFIHDPRYLRPMKSSDNSTKRDRLQIEDVREILAVERKTGIYPMSWYSRHIWEYIKANFEKHPEKVGSVYRDMLKQSMANFMFVLHRILDVCGQSGKAFLLKTLIEPKYECFLHSYEFDAQGEIIRETPRHFTERSNNEIARFTRIAFEAVWEYNEKDNRHASPNLSSSEMTLLDGLCEKINSAPKAIATHFALLTDLIKQVQIRLVR